ncbi:MAG TPA: cold shock domain-containing protein [Cytophagaceae bacterium]|jgi:cold shock CspA family protein|nr:cold shock domain-containing protein [Cytophagaceae bacterium]
MSKSQETWNKKETEKKKQQKKKEKEQKKQERKDNPKSSSMEDMMAYVDEYGNITSTPPDPKKKIKINEADISIGVARQVATEEDSVRKGIVTFFNESKGYGFIKDSESQESIFVHVNGLEEPIKENNKVTFETESSPKGLNAIKVKLAK